jgi:hypothetical protein
MNIPSKKKNVKSARSTRLPWCPTQDVRSARWDTSAGMWPTKRRRPAEMEIEYVWNNPCINIRL